jgi:hypothetical protein
MEWIERMEWNITGMEYTGMETGMDTFGVGGLPSCLDPLSAVCATTNMLILIAS